MVCMKLCKPGLLVSALSALVVCPGWAADEAFTAYSLSMAFSNTTIWTVNGGPGTLSSSPFIGNAVVLHTDGAGKISGSGWFWIDYSNAPYSAFLVDMTGQIIATPAKPLPTVTLSIKGSGYTLDGNGGANLNTLKLKFVGQPGLNPVATNGETGIVGKMVGTVVGKTPFGEKSAPLNLDAIILEAVGYPLVLSAKVVQSAKRMLLYNADFEGSGGGSPNFDLDGKGSVNAKTSQYKFSVKGIGQQRGWAMAVSGALGPYQSTLLTNVVFSAPVSANAKGKINGQVFSATTTDISAEIIT